MHPRIERIIDVLIYGSLGLYGAYRICYDLYDLIVC